MNTEIICDTCGNTPATRGILFRNDNGDPRKINVCDECPLVLGDENLPPASVFCVGCFGRDTGRWHTFAKKQFVLESELSTALPNTVELCGIVYHVVVCDETCEAGSPKGESTWRLTSRGSPRSEMCFQKVLNTIKNEFIETGFVCETCHKLDPNMKRCRDCKKVMYCSFECQLKDLPQHRRICAEPRPCFRWCQI
jgi:hypothetical protein